MTTMEEIKELFDKFDKVDWDEYDQPEEHTGIHAVLEWIVKGEMSNVLSEAIEWTEWRLGEQDEDEED